MSDLPFEPDLVRSFSFESKHVEWGAFSVTVAFRYVLFGAGGSVMVSCQEFFEFPLPEELVPDDRRAAFDRLLDHLGLVAGLSYYKLAAPDLVVVEAGEWSSHEIDVHRLILANGLGEYSFVNDLEPNLCPTFEYRSVAVERRPIDLALGSAVFASGPLVPVGGGKDSCVTIEALRANGLTPTLVTVNRYPVIQEVINVAGLPDIAVRRTLDPQLRWLNDNGARNGHVPATAIVSLAVAATAVLHGFGAVVMSNERSASEGNVVYRGVSINHQWSKSAHAETLLRGLIHGVTGSLDYFSLLRPLSELSIAQRFASTCARYFGSFSSCNAAFRLDPARRVSRWCGQCPKCQFVYLALATVLSPPTLYEIWGSDVFESSPIEGFHALLGLTEWKPFECVGESLECRVALSLLAASASAWSTHLVVRSLWQSVEAAGVVPTETDRRAVFATLTSDAIPPGFRPLVNLTAT